MWLYFDSTGALIEALQHGPAARAGTTDYQIFAYFEGIDVIANGSATVKLVKPDLYDSSYPPLGMNKVSMKFKKLNGENSEHFSVNGGPNGDGTYPGFLFDFSNFSGDQDVAILLDTPGLWRAIISLYGQNHINVQGTSTFNVQYGSIIDEGTELAWEEIVNSIFRIINTKLNIVNGIPVASSTESIDLTEYEVGQVFYIINAGKTTNKLVRIIENQSEEKDFDTLFDFTAYYTKDEIDAKVLELNRAISEEARLRSVADDALSNRINQKQDKLVRDELPTAQLQYAVGFDAQGKLSKGAGGGGGATYEAGYGILIDSANFVISADVSVLATKLDLEGYATTSAVSALSGRVSTIEGLIPAQASSENQLADKNFVNSSIATNTANFIGTFANVTALNNYSGTVTNNDYANVINQELDFATTTEMNAYSKALLTNYDYAWVVNGTKYDLYRFDIETQTWGLRATNIAKTDVSLITVYNRYTYNGALSEWKWNYSINTSGFTAAQWAAINSGVTADLVSRTVTTDETQTITGEKTFSSNFRLRDGNNPYWCFIPGATYLDFASYFSGVLRTLYTFSQTEFITRNNIRPNTDDITDLGLFNRRFKDFYLSGKIKDGTNEVSVADIANGIFNAINASDIASNNELSQAQYDLITNGKPTRIIGTLLGYPYVILYPPTDRGGNDNRFIGKCLVQSNGQSWQETNYIIVKSTKVISIQTSIGFSCETDETRISGLKRINGVGFPNYPSSPIIPQSFNYLTNNTLAYEKVTKYNNVYEYATNSTTVLEYETINNISISADTSFTLATAPANTYPEYKANITNTDASNPITITLPSGTAIKSEPTIVVSSNTFVIPADTTVIVNIQDGLALVMLK